MKFTTILLTTAVFMLIGCKQQNKKESSADIDTTTDTKTIQPKEIPKESKSWLDAVKNKNATALKDTYAENAIKIISSDSTITGSSPIANYYINKIDKIISIESLFRIEANEKKGIDYELVKFKTETSKEYIQLVIWKLEGERKVREFEYTAKSNLAGSEVDLKTIAERRNLWIALCNENNPENLVHQLYTTNAIYFNHKPVIIGAKNIIQEYAYMNNDTYNLILQPLIVELATENIAFEIGQCSGSYGGKYILIWKKESNGKWKIFIDSNI